MQTLVEWHGKVLGKKPQKQGFPDPSAGGELPWPEGRGHFGVTTGRGRSKSLHEKKKKQSPCFVHWPTPMTGEGAHSQSRNVYGGGAGEECAQPCSSETAPKPTSETKLLRVTTPPASLKWENKSGRLHSFRILKSTCIRPNQPNSGR